MVTCRAVTQRRYSRYLSIPLVLLLLSSYGVFSQNKKTKKEDDPKGQTVFRVPVNVVVLNATVTDKNGNPVKDLTADDFRLYEDGKPQPIQTFALESFDSEESGQTEATTSQPKTASPKRGDTLSQMRPRMISIVIDDLTMENSSEFARILDAVKEFINKEMKAGDQVAILSGSRNVRLPFSDNKQHLIEELPFVLEKLNVDTVGRPCGPELTDLEAQVISQTPEGAASLFTPQLTQLCAAAGIALNIAALRQNSESEFRTHSLLQTLRQHIRALRHFKGSKSVVLFSDGIVAQKGTSSAYKLQEVIDLALRSGILLNAVGTRGVQVHMEAMFGSPPAEDKNYMKIGAASAALALDNRWKLLVHEDDKRGQQSPMEQMASDTGGLFHGGNLMDLGLERIARRRISYYILTYIMPQRKAAGGYHNIKLDVVLPGLDVSYRKGYYEPKEELSFETRKKEEIISALEAPGNMNEIPITLSYNYFQEDEFNYSVSFISDVIIRGLQFFEEDARRKNIVSIILAAYDENDRYISGVEKSIDFRLLEDSYTALRDHGLKSGVELKLPMGRYKIKAVVRESNQSKMGSATKSVEIP
jgi:VWFA-related protein